MKHDRIRIAMTNVREDLVDYVMRHDLPFPADDLAGACGICSLLAFRMLKKMGYRPIFHMNRYHCFVTVGHWWVDLTLSQFAPLLDPVFVEPHPYRYEISGPYGFVHESAHQARTETQIRKLFDEWPEEQNPFKQKIPNLHLTNYKP